MTSLVVASRSEHPGVKAFLAALHDEKLARVSKRSA
jgi:hypothetical protein